MHSILLKSLRVVMIKFIMAAAVFNDLFNKAVTINLIKYLCKACHMYTYTGNVGRYTTTTPCTREECELTPPHPKPSVHRPTLNPQVATTP